MKILTLMVGLPRSGKTTAAQELSDRQCAPIVNPDSVRLALHGQRFAAEAEPYVWAIVGTMINALFEAGHDDVILDATNTTRKRRDQWRSDKWARDFYVIDTSKEECIRRAQEQHDSVIIPVIERMAAEYEPVSDEELC